jgi:tetratricopeptide (TPR) repeat protein
MKEQRDRSAVRFSPSDLIAPLLVALATFLVFSGALRHEFLNWDDPTNFLLNQHYRGLGGAQIRWMFTSSLRLGHYMPLTWLTLGLDYSLWGMNPLGYHLTNVVLHCANAAVFYFVSRRLLASAAPEGEAADRNRLDFFAALSALLFALHPLRVESVAWVTERRDVLSGFFCLLSVLCYLRAGNRPGAAKSSRRLAPSVVLFGFSLLSKISAVTLPLALAALDYYPLRRLPEDPTLWFSAKTRPVWREKLPFVLLALPAGLLGIIGQTQAGALRPLDKIGVAERIGVALYGAAFYVRKTIVPWNLSPFYPLPSRPDAFAAPFLLSASLVLAISAVALASRRARPAVLAVWAWFLIILLPVSGLSQSGLQIAADRYTYLPCLGFAVLTAGALSRLQASRRGGWKLAGLIAAVLLGALSLLTRRQIGFWRDSESLWSHAVAVNPHLPLAQTNLGHALFRKGRIDESIGHYELALQDRPDFPEAHNDLGLALAAQGHTDEAIENYDLALAERPNFAEARNNLGLILALQGKRDQAIRQYDLALQERPDFAEAHNSLGLALAGQGNADEAIRNYELALQERPDFAEAQNNLGLALAGQGKTEEAIRHYDLAVPAQPDQEDEAEPHYNLGLAFAGQGKIEEAIREYDLALQARPNYAEAHNNLGKILAGQGKFDDAIRQFDLALKARPDLASAQNNLGLILARQGKVDEAIRHYRLALALQSKADMPFIRNNLASALAQQGKTEEAIQQLRQALEVKPDFASARENLSILLGRTRKGP